MFIDQDIEPLTYLTNTSNSLLFSSERKIAEVVPKLRQAVDSEYKNISVVLFIYKIISLNSNNLLYKYQFGFRKSHSTGYAILTLVDKVSRALDTEKFVVGLYLDIKKAFDAVPHSIFLGKIV